MTSASPAPRPPSRRRCLLARVLPIALAAAALAGGLLDLRPASAQLPEEQPVPPKVEAAVDRALAWLAKNQKPDGSWSQGNVSSTAVPALAAKAFLARGHVPGQGPYGEVINKAIDYLLDSQKPDGLFSKGDGNAVMYEHGITTAMLAEAYGMVDDARKRRIERAMAKSVALILAAQKVDKPAPHAGGWRYSRTANDSDISVTGWQLMALRGAANCGATVPKSALDAGREYVRRCASRGSEGGFQYMAGRDSPSPARTGTGILSLEMLGDHGSKEAIAGGEYLLKNKLGKQEFYYYGVYYISQALYQLGGKYWEQGYPRLRDQLVEDQSDDGSWREGTGQEQEAGPAYRTSMAVLALCVPYRYLPLYQK